MQGVPFHDIAWCPRRQLGQAESSQYCAETDFDADQFESIPGHRGERDVGHPGESPTDDIDDLGVEDISHDQNLVAMQRGIGASNLERGDVDSGAQRNSTRADILGDRPRQEQIVCPPAPNQQSLYPRRAGLDVEADGQVGESSDRAAVGSDDTPAHRVAEQKKAGRC